MAHFAKYKWHEYVGLVTNDRTLHDRDVQLKGPEKGRQALHLVIPAVVEDELKAVAV